MTEFKAVNIVFDGQCAFCIRSLKIVSALDRYRSFRLYDSHQSETLLRFPELRGASVDEVMYTLVDGEVIRAGFFAFRRLIWNIPLTWILIPVFYFPGAGLLGPSLYAWVARNRSRFGCRLDVGDLPAPPRT
jgi:predicted DCC family thiol-disulfide oxidoreductase YuxK